MPTLPSYIGIQCKAKQPQMVQTPAKPLTLEEFLKLPETEPASEYVDGQIIQKPMPQGEHSTIQGELIIAINAVVKPKKVARAFPELRYFTKQDKGAIAFRN